MAAELTLTRTLCEQIAAFDPPAVVAKMRADGVWPFYRCLWCGGNYHVDVGNEPTPLCDECAHEFVQQAATFIDSKELL